MDSSFFTLSSSFFTLSSSLNYWIFHFSLFTFPLTLLLVFLS